MNNKEIKEKIFTLTKYKAAANPKDIKTIIKYHKNNKDNYLVLLENEYGKWSGSSLTTFLSGENVLIIGNLSLNKSLENLENSLVNTIMNGETIYNEDILPELKDKILKERMKLF